MFGEMLTALRERPIPADGLTIVELFELRDVVDAQLCVAVGEFDRSAEWAFDHAVSLHAWLRSRPRCSPRDAGRVATTARKVRALPVVTAAWVNGRLSSGQVDAIVANVTSRTLELFAQQEDTLVPALQDLDVQSTAAAMRHWAAAAEDPLSNPEPATEKPSELHVSATMGGRGAVNGDLGVESTELLSTALGIADSGDLDTPAPQRRANALNDICRFFLDDHTRQDAPPARPGRRRPRPHLHFIVGPDGRAETESGIPVPASTVERLLCDARVNTVKFSDGQVLYYGKDRRTTPDHLYDAMVVRDRGCRFPGCNRPPTWCDSHHVSGWHPRNGDGCTDIDNLVLLCNRHHHLLHKPKWHAKLLPDATFEVTDPSGVTRCTRPPGNPDAKLF